MKTTNEISFNLLFCLIFLIFIGGVFTLSFAQAELPKLFFSDLESGTKTGWQGSPTKGAAISIWGKNFGTTRGASYVTVNGTDLTEDSDYAEWGQIGPARGLQRITFWLNNSCQDGPGEITITINGITSNALPFTIREGNIYFIAKDGNDSNNGRFASDQGGGNGPWLRFYMTNNYPTLQAGDIVYIRAGTYNDIQQESRMIYLYGLAYEPDKPLVVVGYPGEFPVLGTTVSIGVFGRNRANAYLEWHKLIWENSGHVFNISGHNIRLVGNIFRNNTTEASAVVQTNSSWEWDIYGNLWQNTGFDSWKHAIYMTGEMWNVPELYHAVENMDIGWNEFDHYLGWVEGATHTAGGGIVEIKSKDNPEWTNNIFVHDNLFHECTASPMWVTESCYNIYFYNNVMWDILHYTTSSTYGGLKIGTRNTDDRFYIYNNTFYDIGSSQYGIAFIQIFLRSTVQSRNNIFYSINGQPYLNLNTDDVASFVSTNDIYFGGDPPSGNGITVSNPITTDPQFLSIENHDFHLLETSPAIDTGTTEVSSIVTKDYDGILRPQGHSYDIGAYEYISKVTGLERNPLELPHHFDLHQNYPNPFNPGTTITYEVASIVNINLAIYDTLGKLVVTLVNEEQSPGRKEVRWDGRDNNGLLVSSGVYFVTLSGKTFAKTRKILLVR
jgi:hypothetical protein